MNSNITDKCNDLKITYIGGGSRGWAWGLMTDLANEKNLSGEVRLYDINKNAALDNEIIGNKSGGNFRYKAVYNLKESLNNADFVIISILPGTFDEMESDVHTPEKYGIYQSVGDTTGPGGLFRALRTIPMYVEFAQAIMEICPNAWVINYTNPMGICVATLYNIFPKIKAFGCCHEVFGTQKMLCKMLKENGISEDLHRTDLNINPMGINHFTWITKAHYKNIDLFPIYKDYCAKHTQGVCDNSIEQNNKYLKYNEKVKFDLFNRFGIIASAGDRHLAEFCPGNWYLKDRETVEKWGFGLTPVSWRRDDLAQRFEKSKRMLASEAKFEPRVTDEDGVKQIKAILGLGTLITNVNLPNIGQIENVALGTIVETNAVFCGDSVIPIHSGRLPDNIMPIATPAIYNQKNILSAALNKDTDLAFAAFCSDLLTSRLSIEDSKKLFNEMMENTKKYLTGWQYMEGTK